MGVLLLAAGTLPALSGRTSQPAAATVRMATRMEPPRWAALERQLLSENVPACRELFARCFDGRGYLQRFVR